MATASLISAASNAAVVARSSSAFVPRQTFDVSQNLVRTYFLGHHVAALTNMGRALTNIGLVIECRDSRVPLTSSNPMLEKALAGRDRIIVYTKSRLCFPPARSRQVEERQLGLLRVLQAQNSCRDVGAIFRGEVPRTAGFTDVLYADEAHPAAIDVLLEKIKERARARGLDSLIGLRAFIVGMPNVGKSSLLNALRRRGMNLDKAARTGGSPGVTRKLSTPVRIIPQDVGGGIEQGVYVIDTPGVFVHQVAEAEAMVKLCLVGCVKDSIVPAEVLADYLLYRMNLEDPRLYAAFCPPTNDADQFLDAIAIRTGNLRKGATPARDAAATWIIQQYRKGKLGVFCLDEVTPETVRRGPMTIHPEPPSRSKAERLAKEARKQKVLAKRLAKSALR